MHLRAEGFSSVQENQREPERTGENRREPGLHSEKQTNTKQNPNLLGREKLVLPRYVVGWAWCGVHVCSTGLHPLPSAGVTHMRKLPGLASTRVPGIQIPVFTLPYLPPRCIIFNPKFKPLSICFFPSVSVYFSGIEALPFVNPPVGSWSIEALSS